MPSSKSLKQGLALADHPASTLRLSVGSLALNAGTFISRAEAQSSPSLSFDAADSSKTYMAVCLDIDAPFASFAVLSPILHWIQPGLKQISHGSSKLESADAVIVPYIGPAPPPGSGPHRYVFLLYEQPHNFDVAWFVPKNGASFSLSSRVRFDWDAWEQRANLAKPVAANFFTSN